MTSPKIALIGEAYGEQEEFYRKPFVGPAGQEFDRMLAEASLSREDCFVTNVFNFRPAGNDLSTLCVSAGDGGKAPGLGPLLKGKYLKAEYLPELDRLYRELSEVKPNLVVLLGNTAVWAVLGGGQISKIRGTVSESPILRGQKCLATYHPAAVLRQYELRPTTILDLQKAAIEAEFPEVRRPRREVWLDPTFEDIRFFIENYIVGAKTLAFDIETSNKQITCISFAPSKDRALVIPFVDVRKPGANYWPTLAEELEAWSLVRYILNLPIPKVGQNGLYDIQYLWYAYGIPVRNYAHDTMLLHHSLHPESQKSLDFLGSIYTNEVAWKTHRPRGKFTIKRED